MIQGQLNVLPFGTTICIVLGNPYATNGFQWFLIGLAERLHLLKGGVAGKEFGSPQLLFRSHWTDSCSTLSKTVIPLSTLGAREASKHACFLVPASTESLTSRYRMHIMLSLVYCRLTNHN